MDAIGDEKIDGYHCAAFHRLSTFDSVSGVRIMLMHLAGERTSIVDVKLGAPHLNTHVFPLPELLGTEIDLLGSGSQKSKSDPRESVKPTLDFIANLRFDLGRGQFGHEAVVT